MRQTASTTNHILEFIRARHISDMKESKKHQTWLKKKLKKQFTAVLLKHGDPDRDYMGVMFKWFEEATISEKQGASGR